MYGLMIGIGLIIALALLWWLCRRFNVSDKTYNFYWILGVVSIAIGFVGANVFQNIYQAVQVAVEGGKFEWTWGVTFMGGLVFGVVTFILGAMIFAKRQARSDFYRVASLGAPCIAVAHAFGRIGCFCAPCCYGIVDEHFGMDFPYHHNALPTMLYESIFLFILFGVLMLVLLKFNKPNLTLIIYGFSYSTWRFCLEFIRGDNRWELGNSLTPSQWQSVVLFGVALILCVCVLGFKKIPLYKPQPERAGNANGASFAAEADEFYRTESPSEAVIDAGGLGAGGLPAAPTVGFETDKAGTAGTAEMPPAYQSAAPSANVVPLITPARRFLIGASVFAGLFLLLGIIAWAVKNLSGAVVLFEIAAGWLILALIDSVKKPPERLLYDRETQTLFIYKKGGAVFAPEAAADADEAEYISIPLASITEVYSEKKQRDGGFGQTLAAGGVFLFGILLGWIILLFPTKKLNRALPPVVIKTGNSTVYLYNVKNSEAVDKMIELKPDVTNSAETNIDIK